MSPNIKTSGTDSPRDLAVITATRRWLEGAVFGINLCPFARAPLAAGRIRFSVSSAETQEALLDDLLARATVPNHVYVHRWRVGDLLLWDNRCTQHYALDDYSELRRMRRVQIDGDAPY